MAGSTQAAPRRSLRATVLEATGQDLRRCAHCSFCADVVTPDQDISLESLVLLVLMDDDEVLTSRALWSPVMEAARAACAGNLDMPAVLQALRREAARRGIVPPG